MTNRKELCNHGCRAITWLSVGALVSGFFAFEILLPLRAAIVVMMVLVLAGIAAIRVSELSLLPRLFVFLYSLPFLATVGYLFDPSFVWTRSVELHPLCQNHDLMSRMMAIGTVGLCGLMAGIEAAACRRNADISVQGTTRPQVSLPISVATLLLLSAVFFSWLHSPAKPIYVAAYFGDDSGRGYDVAIGARASFLISYLFLVLLAVDAERESSIRIRKLKTWGILLAVGYIVIILQLLRGDRECLGLVIALAILFITRDVAGVAELRFYWFGSRVRRALLIAIPFVCFVLMLMAIGSLRRSAADISDERSESAGVLVKYFCRNTWTAVSLNVLGIARDSHCANVDYLYGRTYLDYLLSLPPDFVSRRIGYARPIDGPANPAMWYRGTVSRGGMHPAVVPFRNFGIWGVLLVLFAVGVFISRCEIRNERGAVADRLLYGFIAATSTGWFWYGDMALIRTMMMWGILTVVYRLLTIGLFQSGSQFDDHRLRAAVTATCS